MVLTFMLKLDEVKTAVSKMEKKPIITVIHQPGEEVPDGIQSFMELFMVDEDDQKAVDKVSIIIIWSELFKIHIVFIQTRC